MNTDPTWTTIHAEALREVGRKGELHLHGDEPVGVYYDDLWRRGLITFSRLKDHAGIKYSLTNSGHMVLRDLGSD